jgi:hypothetical protein
MAIVPPRGSRLPWLIAGVAVIGAAAAAITVVSLRGEVPVTTPAVSRDAGVVVVPPPPDASAVPAIAIDAGIVVAGPPDAALVTPIDAAPPDAPSIDAGRRHRPPHNGSGGGNHPGSGAAPRTGSGAPACDRSIDIDCDGIPDVR